MKKTLMALLCVSIVGGVWGNNTFPNRMKNSLLFIQTILFREALSSR